VAVTAPTRALPRSDIDFTLPAAGATST